MKALLFAILTLSLSSAFAVDIKANLSGQAVESQLVTVNSQDRTLREVGAASLKEGGRSQTADEMTIFFLGSDGRDTNYLSVLHEISDLTLTLDMNAMSAHGENTEISAKVQIMGDDDQIRKAEGSCVVDLASELSCRLTPTFNAYGLIGNTQLTFHLQ